MAKTFKDSTPYYKIEDLNGEEITGIFYQEELQKIDKTDNIFKIERIIKKRSTRKSMQYLVKWLGFPESFDSWVDKKDLKCLN